MAENVRTMGTVQWFSRVKGYGFVRPDNTEEDVFVHYSVIRGEGYRNLNKGQRVEFTIEDSPKGPQAVDVIGLEGVGVVNEPAQAVDVTGLEGVVSEPAQAVEVIELEGVVSEPAQAQL